MDIQKINSNIKWQQLTAKEILEITKEGEEVPSEYSKWAAAISAVLKVNDEVTYEMTNGETDISALEETLGREMIKINLVETEESNMENMTGENTNKGEIPVADMAEQDEITLADQTITTDPNEILKRKIRKGLTSLS